MKTKLKHPLARCVSVRRRRRGPFRILLLVGAVLGIYLVLKAVVPALAGLLDAVCATLVFKAAGTDEA